MVSARVVSVCVSRIGKALHALTTSTRMVIQARRRLQKIQAIQQRSLVKVAANNPIAANTPRLRRKILHTPRIARRMSMGSHVLVRVFAAMMVSACASQGDMGFAVIRLSLLLGKLCAILHVPLMLSVLLDLLRSASARRGGRGQNATSRRMVVLSAVEGQCNRRVVALQPNPVVQRVVVVTVRAHDVHGLGLWVNASAWQPARSMVTVPACKMDRSVPCLQRCLQQPWCC